MAAPDLPGPSNPVPSQTQPADVGLPRGPWTVYNVACLASKFHPSPRPRYNIKHTRSRTAHPLLRELLRGHWLLCSTASFESVNTSATGRSTTVQQHNFERAHQAQESLHLGPSSLVLVTTGFSSRVLQRVTLQRDCDSRPARLAVGPAVSHLRHRRLTLKTWMTDMRCGCATPQGDTAPALLLFMALDQGKFTQHIFLCRGARQGGARFNWRARQATTGKGDIEFRP